jgi:hypothetical protein
MFSPNDLRGRQEPSSQKLILAVKIGYNVDMTKSSAISEPLGSPLPGMICLPFWRTTIEKRGSSDVLAWQVADSPAPPPATAVTLISAPRPVSSVTLKRGRETGTAATQAF